MFNRWIHICQAIDFKTSTITTVANGFVYEDSAIGWKPYNESNPLGRIEKMKDSFILGLHAEAYGWFGKLILIF